jgi:hypothetical protein
MRRGTALAGCRAAGPGSTGRWRRAREGLVPPGLESRCQFFAHPLGGMGVQVADAGNLVFLASARPGSRECRPRPTAVTGVVTVWPVFHTADRTRGTPLRRGLGLSTDHTYSSSPLPGRRYTWLKLPRTCQALSSCISSLSIAFHLKQEKRHEPQQSLPFITSQ